MSDRLDPMNAQGELSHFEFGNRKTAWRILPVAPTPVFWCSPPSEGEQGSKPVRLIGFHAKAAGRPPVRGPCLLCRRVALGLPYLCQSAAKPRQQFRARRWALALSDRTLSRRLSEEGTSYADVVDQLRRSLALQYLKIRACRFPRSRGCSATRVRPRLIMLSSVGRDGRP
jgi:hypothetical protein